VLTTLALQAAGAPVALIALMAVFGVGFALTTMAGRAGLAWACVLP
jgi:Na+-driven multidrug efflux pump